MNHRTHRNLVVNSIDMHFVEQGDGPVVLLCHGFPETWYSWRHQLEALAAAGYRAVAPDLRGYGGTSAPADAGQYTIMHLVADMVALLDALGTSQACIAGNDWGATVAWHAALLRPDRFSSIVALGVPMMAPPPMPPTQLFPQNQEELFYALYFQAPGVAEAELEIDTALSLRKIIFAASGEAGPRRAGDGTPNPFAMVPRANGLLAALPDPKILPDWLTQADMGEYTRAFARSGFRGGLNFYRNLDRNRELMSAFSGMQVRIPALYIIGERDPGRHMPGMQTIVDSMRSSVPLLDKTVTVSSAGHWLQQEKPARVSSEMVKFLEARQT